MGDISWSPPQQQQPYAPLPSHSRSPHEEVSPPSYNEYLLSLPVVPSPPPPPPSGDRGTPPPYIAAPEVVAGGVSPPATRNHPVRPPKINPFGWLRILSWNVRSLRSRLAALLLLVREQRPHVLALQEVYALEEESLSCLAAEGYALLASRLRPGARDGGVAIFVDITRLLSICLPTPDCLHPLVECCAVTVIALMENSVPVTVVNWYVPPEPSTVNLGDELTKINDSLHPHYIIGDPNARDWSWCPKFETARGLQRKRGREICWFVMDTDFDVVTKGERTLVEGTAPDVFLARGSLGSEVDILTGYPVVDHLPALLSCSTVVIPQSYVTRHPPISWKKAQLEFPEFFAKVEEKLPSPSGDLPSLMHSWGRFSSSVQRELRTLPRASCRMSFASPELSAPLKELRQRVKAAWAASSPDLRHLLRSFDDGLKEWHEKLLKEKGSRLSMTAPSGSSWSKDLWRYFGEVSSGRPHGLSSLTKPPDPSIPGAPPKILSPATQAHVFSKLYKEKHQRRGVKPPNTADSSRKTVDPITDGEFLTAMNQMKTDQAADTWGIKPILWKKMTPSLRSWMIKSMTSMLEWSWVPGECRTAETIPVLKEGKPPSEIKSYRPVSITLLLARILERIVQRRLLRHFFLANRETVHKWQHGFTKGRDTSLPLFHLLSMVGDTTHTKYATYKGRETKVVRGKGLILAIDFSDAFCRLLQESVEGELKKRAVPEYLIRWVVAFLTDRTMRVFINGKFSAPVPLEVGAPQGSILGPTLWNLVFDTLLVILEKSKSLCLDGRGVSGGCAAFADDLTLAGGHGNLELVAEGLRLWAKRVTEWAKKEEIMVSVKTVLLLISRDPRIVEADAAAFKIPIGDLIVTASLKPVDILGLRFDSTLSFGQHVEKLAKEVKPILFQLKRISCGLSPHCMSPLVQGCVISRLQYVLPLFWPQLSKHRRHVLSILWNMAARLMTGTVRSANHIACLAEAGMRSLDVLSAKRAASLVARIRGLDGPADIQRQLQDRKWVAGGLLPVRKKSKGSQKGEKGPIYPFPLRTSLIPFEEDKPPASQPSSFPALTETPPWDLGNVFRETKFLVDTGTVRASSSDVLRRAFGEQQLERAPADSLRVWTDGSVVEPINDKPRRSGSAAVIEGGETIHLSLGRFACSYSAERLGIVGILRRILELVVMGPSSFSCISLFSDSLSCLLELQKGPFEMRNSQMEEIWHILLRMYKEFHISVLFVFVFSHCGLPGSDYVDGQAKVAMLDESLVPSPSWPKDGVRDVYRKDKELYDSRLKMESGLRGVWPKLGRVTYLWLSRSSHRLLFQLRTGVCPGLGGLGHSVMDPCRHCKRLVMGRKGLAVRHLFSCDAAIPVALREQWKIKEGLVRQLWTHPNASARYAMGFLMTVSPDDVDPPDHLDEVSDGEEHGPEVYVPSDASDAEDDNDVAEESGEDLEID